MLTSDEGSDGRGVEKDSLTELIVDGRTADEATDAADDEHDEQHEADELGDQCHDRRDTTDPQPRCMRSNKTHHPPRRP